MSADRSVLKNCLTPPTLLEKEIFVSYDGKEGYTPVSDTFDVHLTLTCDKPNSIDFQ